MQQPKLLTCLFGVRDIPVEIILPEKSEPDEGIPPDGGGVVFRNGDRYRLRGMWFRIKSMRDGILVLKQMPSNWEPDA